MDKASIKGVSVSELEAAIAEVLNRFTNTEWAVTVGAISYPEMNGIDAVLYGNRESLQLSMKAEEVVPSPLDSL